MQKVATAKAAAEKARQKAIAEGRAVKHDEQDEQDEAIEKLEAQLKEREEAEEREDEKEDARA
jgi:translation initiation factor IF-3